MSDLSESPINPEAKPHRPSLLLSLLNSEAKVSTVETREGQKFQQRRVDLRGTEVIVRNPPLMLPVRNGSSLAIGFRDSERHPDDTSAPLLVEALFS